MKRIWLVTAAALVTALLCEPLAAQGPPRRGRRPAGPPPEQRGDVEPGRRGQGPPDRQPPGGPGFNFLSSEMRFEGRLVKGAPYSAVAVTESVQTLADGTRLTRQLTASIWRDSEGRTRREQKMDLIGPLSAAGEAPMLIFINDVVAGVHFALDPRDKTARRMQLPQDGRGPRPPFPQFPEDRVSVESLGRRAIEGVEAEGARTTVTIPTGEIGNDRPIEIISERWEAVDLQIVVLSRHTDPRFGETSFRITNLVRGEPDRSLFVVPDDYRLADTMVRPRRRPREER